MMRCHSCNGMIKKNEGTCYTCGDLVPKEPKSNGGFVSTLLIVGLVLALGFLAVSYFSGPIQNVIPSSASTHKVSAVLSTKHRSPRI